MRWACWAASATLQASGGLDVLLQGAARVLRRNPKYVSILAPLTTRTLTMLCGTGHVVYTMLPIIYDVAIKNGIRPERPMAASSITSQMGIIASPVSVAVVSLVSLVAFLAKALAGAPIIGVVTLLSITIPSTLIDVLIVAFTRTNPTAIGKTEVFRAGMIAVVAVFGVAWMADTVFEANLPGIKAALSEVVKSHPWTFALALLLVSKLVNSQAAAISAMVPLGLAIGVPPGYVVAFAAACYGYYILPTYPSDLASIQFDRSGTTHIGKYVINHSFIGPGLIGVSSSCLAGYLLAASRGLV